MAEIVNLNRARKAKKREASEAKAAQNRAAHGRTRIEKLEAKVEAARRERALDGAKREP